MQEATPTRRAAGPSRGDSVSRAQGLLTGIWILGGKSIRRELESWRRCNLCLRNLSKQREEKRCSGFFLPPAQSPRSVPPNLIRNQMGKGTWGIFPQQPPLCTEQSRIRVGDRSAGEETSREAQG